MPKSVYDEEFKKIEKLNAEVTINIFLI